MSYQPPSQPFPPQQPQWQPPPYYPPPEHYQRAQQAAHYSFIGSRWSWLVIGLILGVLIGYTAHVPISSSTNIAATPIIAQNTDAANQPTSIPTSTNHSVGAPVSIGAWLITVNGATIHTNSQFSNPKAGDVFLVVDVTSENTASSNQDISSEISFRLLDSTGQSYTEAITGIGKPPDGTVPAQSKLRGQISYEVPASEHSFTFEFLDLATQDSATWNISVK